MTLTSAKGQRMPTWLLRRGMTGLAVALMMLLVAEGLLRLLPLNRWGEVRPNITYPVFVLGAGESAGQFITNPHFWGAMGEQRFAMVKPAKVKRIFVLGGSAALGWPGPPPTAFTGYLQRALDVVVPGRYEVVNAAAMSYGSHRVADVLADVIKMEPDLILIWSGNNEYIERNMLPLNFHGEAGRRLQRLLRQSALYRTVRLSLLRISPGLFARPRGEDITDFRRTPRVRRGMLGRSPEMDRQVLDNYRANLSSMAAMLRQAGIPGYFCTVPVNLADWMPADVPPQLAVEVADHWGSVRQLMVTAVSEGRFSEALEYLDEILNVTPDYAYAHFLLGKSYLALGRFNEALVAFKAACTFDPRPIRATPIFQETIRKIAAVEGLGLVDLEQAFANAGFPGLDHFLDYVHPNEAGNKLAAISVAEALGRHLELPATSGHIAEIIRRDDSLQRDTGSRADYAYALGMTLANNGDLLAAEKAYLQALEENPQFPEPAGSLGVIYEQLGEYARALEFYRYAHRLDPGSVHVIPFARLLYQMGNPQEAREIAERVYRQGVENIFLYQFLAELALTEGRLSEALLHFQEALRTGGSDPSIFLGLAETYRRMGDERRAGETLRHLDGSPRW